MTSGKKGSNPPREFICEFCGNKFSRIVPASMQTPRFCSKGCGNRYKASKKIKINRGYYPSSHYPCSVCGEYTGERRKDVGMCRKCFRKHQHIVSNPPDLVKFIVDNYNNLGGKKISEITGHPVGRVRRIAYNLGLLVSKDTYKEVVHGAAKKYMTENNPMFEQETRNKVAEYWELHPEEKEKLTIKFMEGHQRIQKNKPTKLELRLYEYLDQLGVDFEPQFLVKPKFIVDALVGDSIIIQADGDYWHGHPRFGNLTERQDAQQKRDRAQDKYLKTCGYKVIRIWESDMSFDTVKKSLENIHAIIPLDSEVSQELQEN